MGISIVFYFIKLKRSDPFGVCCFGDPGTYTLNKKGINRKSIDVDKRLSKHKNITKVHSIKEL